MPRPVTIMAAPVLVVTAERLDLAEVYCRLARARSLFCLWYVRADMQLKAVIPDQATRAAVFGQINGQNQGRATLAHWQNHAPMFTREGLRRPFNRVEAFRAPGVLHCI